MSVALLATVSVVFGGEDPAPGIVRDPVLTVAGLSFIESHGSAGHDNATLSAPEGGLSLLFFGFLSCPDVCPMTMADIGVTRQRLSAEIDDRIEFAFVV